MVDGSPLADMVEVVHRFQLHLTFAWVAWVELYCLSLLYISLYNLEQPTTQRSQTLKWVCLGLAKFLCINLVAYSARIALWLCELIE